MVVLKEITLPNKNQVHLLCHYMRLWAPVFWIYWMTENSYRWTYLVPSYKGTGHKMNIQDT